MSFDSTLLLQAAAQAAGAQQYPKGALYVVATPLGNLADLSLRAIHVLSLVDRVACEDTRVAARLLQHLGLRKPLLPVHTHNEAQQAAELVSAMHAGERVAYVSDAGTPGVSDPGARLVAAAAGAGLVVVPVPGPSAVAALLSVAGDVQAEGYRFAGFLPAKGQARRDALARLLAERAGACVLYEAPHRIEQLARELAEADAGRSVTLGRELTKQFETIATMPAGELPGWLAADANRLRGEFAMLIHAVPGTAEAAGDVHDALLRALLDALPLKQAAEVAAQATGASRKDLYRRALDLQRDAGA